MATASLGIDAAGAAVKGVVGEVTKGVVKASVDYMTSGSAPEQPNVKEAIGLEARLKSKYQQLAPGSHNDLSRQCATLLSVYAAEVGQKIARHEHVPYSQLGQMVTRLHALVEEVDRVLLTPSSSAVPSAENLNEMNALTASQRRLEQFLFDQVSPHNSLVLVIGRVPSDNLALRLLQLECFLILDFANPADSLRRIGQQYDEMHVYNHLSWSDILDDMSIEAPTWIALAEDKNLSGEETKLMRRRVSNLLSKLAKSRDNARLFQLVLDSDTLPELNRLAAANVYMPQIVVGEEKLLAELNFADKDSDSCCLTPDEVSGLLSTRVCVQSSQEYIKTVQGMAQFDAARLNLREITVIPHRHQSYEPSINIDYKQCAKTYIETGQLNYNLLLAGDYVVERTDFVVKLCHRLGELSQSTSPFSIFILDHQPGAGASTICRLAMWSLQAEYCCLDITSLMTSNFEAVQTELHRLCQFVRCSLSNPIRMIIFIDKIEATPMMKTKFCDVVGSIPGLRVTVLTTNQCSYALHDQALINDRTEHRMFLCWEVTSVDRQKFILLAQRYCTENQTANPYLYLQPTIDSKSIKFSPASLILCMFAIGFDKTRMGSLIEQMWESVSCSVQNIIATMCLLYCHHPSHIVIPLSAIEDLLRSWSLQDESHRPINTLNSFHSATGSLLVRVPYEKTGNDAFRPWHVVAAEVILDLRLKTHSHLHMLRDIQRVFPPTKTAKDSPIFRCVREDLVKFLTQPCDVDLIDHSFDRHHRRSDFSDVINWILAAVANNEQLYETWKFLASELEDAEVWHQLGRFAALRLSDPAKTKECFANAVFAAGLPSANIKTGTLTSIRQTELAFYHIPCAEALMEKKDCDVHVLLGALAAAIACYTLSVTADTDARNPYSSDSCLKLLNQFFIFVNSMENDQARRTLLSHMMPLQLDPKEKRLTLTTAEMACLASLPEILLKCEARLEQLRYIEKGALVDNSVLPKLAKCPARKALHGCVTNHSKIGNLDAAEQVCLKVLADIDGNLFKQPPFRINGETIPALQCRAYLREMGNDNSRWTATHYQVWTRLYLQSEQPINGAFNNQLAAWGSLRERVNHQWHMCNVISKFVALAAVVATTLDRNVTELREAVELAQSYHTEYIARSTSRLQAGRPRRVQPWYYYAPSNSVVAATIISRKSPSEERFWELVREDRKLQKLLMRISGVITDVHNGLVNVSGYNIPYKASAYRTSRDRVTCYVGFTLNGPFAYDLQFSTPSGGEN